MLKGKTVVTIPGCPANPYNFLGTVLQYATFGTLPELDEIGRPMFAYGRTIHEHCPRRAHFDAGRFAEQFGDEGHRRGYCLYKLGCKGPQTHANCSVLTFGEVVDAWPIGIGHPCFGCTEQKLAFRVPCTTPWTSTGRRRPTPTRRCTRRKAASSAGGHRRRGRRRRRAARRRLCGLEEDDGHRRDEGPRRKDGGVMMGISRRTALKGMLAGAAGAGAPRASARPSSPPADAPSAALRHDALHRLQGLRVGVRARPTNLERRSGWPGGSTTRRSISTSATKNVIKLYKDGDGAVVLQGAVHALHRPACVGACMLGRFKKREFGIVTYDPDLCIGCRYCQMACPFNVPKFEWAKATPKIVKCELCRHRLAERAEPRVRRGLPDRGA